MVYDYFEKYTFICDWYDEEAGQMRELCLNFFPYDNSVQILDIGRGKRFVSRVHYPSLKVKMLQIESTIRVFSRLLYIKSCTYATRCKLFENFQSTFALIKPVPEIKYGKIITFILENGFQIVQLKKVKVDKNFAILMYKSIGNDPNLPIITEYIISGEVVGMELTGADAIKRWRKAIGYRDPAQAAPGTLRRMYGESIIRNIVHGADCITEVQECIPYFFGINNKVMMIPMKPTLKNCTCCIIKPHALTDGTYGKILEMISSANFKINAMAMFTVDLVNAAEFYEVYKNVLPEYEEMTAQLSQGQCVALELLGENSDKDCACEFRKLCGPRDPDLCRQLFPDSIRARYGHDTVHNAVHCTDLKEDGVLEVEYFFKILTMV